MLLISAIYLHIDTKRISITGDYFFTSPSADFFLKEIVCKSTHHGKNKSNAIVSRELVQLLMTHSTEAFDSVQNVAARVPKE